VDDPSDLHSVPDHAAQHTTRARPKSILQDAREMTARHAEELSRTDPVQSSLPASNVDPGPASLDNPLLMSEVADILAQEEALKARKTRLDAMIRSGQSYAGEYPALSFDQFLSDRLYFRITINTFSS